jgi:hypothetical protein
MEIGTKVVCIDDSPSKCRCCLGEPTGLIKNQVYVIEGFEIDGFGTLGLVLVGTRPKPKSHPLEGKGFNVRRFRSLDHIKELNSLKQQLLEKESFLTT